MKNFKGFLATFTASIGMVLVLMTAAPVNAGDVVRWRLQTVDDPGLMEYKAIAVTVTTLLTGAS